MSAVTAPGSCLKVENLLQPSCKHRNCKQRILGGAHYQTCPRWCSSTTPGNCRLRNCPITRRSDCQQCFLFDLRPHLRDRSRLAKFDPFYRFLRYLRTVAICSYSIIGFPLRTNLLAVLRYIRKMITSVILLKNNRSIIVE